MVIADSCRLPEAEWAHNIPSTSSAHHSASTMAGLVPGASSATLVDPLYGFPAPPLSMSGNDDLPYGTFLPPHMAMPIPPAAPPHPTPPPVQATSGVRKDEYISYYFKYVRELQWVFAGDALTNILLPVSVRVSFCSIRQCVRAPLRLRACISFPANTRSGSGSAGYHATHLRCHCRQLDLLDLVGTRRPGSECSNENPFSV